MSNTDQYTNGSKIYMKNGDVSSYNSIKKILKTEGYDSITNTMVRLPLSDMFETPNWGDDVNPSIIYWDNTDNLYCLKVIYHDTSSIPIGTLTIANISTYFDKIGGGGSAATETDPIFLAQKGVASGVATLDATGKVPLTQLPANVAETATQTPSAAIVSSATQEAITGTDVQANLASIATSLKTKLTTEIDPTAIKKAGLIGSKLLTSTGTTGTDGIVVESTITKVALEAQLVAPYANALTLDARLTAIETAQPTFDDVVIVTSLPATGETGKQYIVTAGANKGQTFYWDGTTFSQADQDVAIFANIAAFPVTGNNGTVYVDKATKKSYIWDGLVYTELSAVPAITNVITNSTNTLTSTVNGTVSTTPIVNTNALSLSSPNLTSTVNGIASNVLNLTPLLTSATTNVLSSSVNTLTSTNNGVIATAPIVNSNVLTSAVNSMTSTVNGVVATVAPIINTNIVSLNGTGDLVSTVNGVASTPLTLPIKYTKYEYGYELGSGTVGQMIETASLSISSPSTCVNVSAILVNGTSIANTITVESLSGTIYATVAIPATATVGTAITGTINITALPANTLLVIKNSVANLGAQIAVTLTTK
jgi:hypothetical protein